MTWLGLTERLLLVLVGALLGWFTQQYRAARSEDTSIINDHIKDIDKFADAAVSYWLRNPSDNDDEQRMAVAVLSSWSLISRVYPSVQRASAEPERKYEDLVFRLYSAATSGAFQQAGRNHDPDRALEVADVASELVAYLRAARQHILSTRRMIDGVRIKMAGIWNYSCSSIDKALQRTQRLYRGASGLSDKG